jgi:putative redox protein
MSAEDPNQPGRHLSFAQARIGADGHRTEITMANDHGVVADQPIYQNGTNEGPTPVDLMLAALCACKASVMRSFADRKQWPLDEAIVRARLRRIPADKLDAGAGATLVDLIECEIELAGNLTENQRERIIAASKACPVQRVFANQTAIATTVTHRTAT